MDGIWEVGWGRPELLRPDTALVVMGMDRSQYPGQ